MTLFLCIAFLAWNKELLLKLFVLFDTLENTVCWCESFENNGSICQLLLAFSDLDRSKLKRRTMSNIKRHFCEMQLQSSIDYNRAYSLRYITKVQNLSVLIFSGYLRTSYHASNQ